PAAWTTLYELSRLEADQLEQAIEDGRVTPELGRGQAQKLASRGYRRQYSPMLNVRGPVLDRSSELNGRCDGCALCGGHVAHYTTTPVPGLALTVYVDGHGVIYESYDDPEALDEQWTLEQ